LVLADDPDLLERMRLFRSHGMRSTRKYFHELPGHNFRLTNLQAAMLCAQFSHRQELSGMRDKVFAGYKTRLPDARFQHIPAEVNPVMWAVGIRLAAGRRDAVMQNLRAANIETRPGFPAMSEQPLYQASQASRLPVSERIASEVLCLPAPADLSETEMDRICSTLNTRL
jgi:perosamine synthetase